MQFLDILGKSILHRFSKLLNDYIFKDFNWTENKMVQLSVVYCASQILEEQTQSGKGNMVVRRMDLAGVKTQYSCFSGQSLE